jgi:hypothetical protein
MARIITSASPTRISEGSTSESTRPAFNGHARRLRLSKLTTDLSERVSVPPMSSLNASRWRRRLAWASEGSAATIWPCNPASVIAASE